MQKFDELNRVYFDWRKRNRDYAMQAALFVQDFAAELARQIEAPKSFRLPIKGTEVPYVRALKFDPETSNYDPLQRGDTLFWDDNDGKPASAFILNHLDATLFQKPNLQFAFDSICAMDISIWRFFQTVAFNSKSTIGRLGSRLSNTLLESWSSRLA
jgi:hypothetical protein